MMRLRARPALAVAGLVVIAACSGSSTKAEPRATTTTVGSFPRQVPVESLSAQVRAQLRKADTVVTEIQAGIYKRPSDGLLLGKCSVVDPYVEKHGKPNGFTCFEAD